MDRNDLSAEFDGSFISGGKHYLLSGGKIFIGSTKFFYSIGHKQEIILPILEHNSNKLNAIAE